jgi:restriction system protein
MKEYQAMPIPSYQTLMLPLLRLMSQGERRVSDCFVPLADEFNLSEAEREEILPSGRQKYFENRVHWARSYLGQAMLTRQVSHGVHVITERGESLLAESPDNISRQMLINRYSEFRDWCDRSKTPKNNKVETVAQPIAEDLDDMAPVERIEQAYAELEADLRASLLENVLQLSPGDFERLIVELLVKMGYGGNVKEAGNAIGRSGDGGIDGIIKEDTLGLDIIYLQAKLYSDTKIGEPDIRDFAGSLDGVQATKGVFVTTTDFSNPARQYVDRIPKRIILINGQELAELMIEHGVGVRSQDTYVLKKIDEEYFS